MIRRLAVAAVLACACLASGCIRDIDDVGRAPYDPVVRTPDQCQKSHVHGRACGYQQFHHFWYDLPDRQNDLPYHPEPRNAAEE